MSGVIALSGCVSTGSGKMGLDFGEVLAKEQQVFSVNGERAALRRYYNDSYDIKLYGQKKVMELDVKGSMMMVANVSEVPGATLITLDVPEAGCSHVYHVYRVSGTQSSKYQTGYRSCEGPLSFNVANGQWTARQTVKPAVGKPYMLVYQDGNLYTRPLEAAKPRVPAKPRPKAPPKAAAPKPAAPDAVNLDDVAAPAAAAANLDEIDAPPPGKINTSGLKADSSSDVKMKDEK
ncbi:hypothetical protein [Achromobacter arsenitoxydans]|uniref:Uncharacterized protein n=1 Tax=Achromobacter arsenitoxydans SY8 TaxID=477184 RepID=H0FCS1_9BURK|nr:hypothetical protein [Achromobacter arsenitoxydans]EHK64026.1 hypothetical protein KYC_22901 [Achromobacter arsenitoxydans SY8]